jgi:hypothetical protein
LTTRHFYAVTCQHLAPLGSSTIRINTNDGTSRFIKTHADDWEWIPGHDDLAAIDLTERLNRSSDTISFIQQRLFVTHEFIEEVELGIGEDGFMLGLLANVPGEKRNLIAGRFGNLSLLADKDIKIKQGNENHRSSHIFDIRSRTGFSGSPVFIYRTPAGDLRDSVEYRPPPRVMRYTEMTKKDHLEADAKYNAFVTDAAKNQFIRLLGIHTAQYHDTVRAYKIPKTQPESDALVRDGDKLRIPNSMSVVAPAWEIFKLLDHPKFKEQRRLREEAMIKRKKENEPNEPQPEAVATEAAPSAAHPSTDANPNHRADFMRLASAAARKQTQDE